MAEKPEDLFHYYFEYSKPLRTWFIIFGVGVPSTIFVHDALKETVLFSTLRQRVRTFIRWGKNQSSV